MTTLAVVVFMLVAVVLMLASGQTAPVRGRLRGHRARAVRVLPLLRIPDEQDREADRKAPGSRRANSTSTVAAIPRRRKGSPSSRRIRRPVKASRAALSRRIPAATHSRTRSTKPMGEAPTRSKSRGRDPNDDEDDISVTGSQQCVPNPAPLTGESPAI